LPNQDVSEILEFEKNLNKNINTIAIIGIGGSSLGAKAVYYFLKPVKKLKREFIFFESTDPININELLDKINLNNTLFLIISKSGTTIETIAIYKYILSLKQNLNSIFITESGSKLENYAKEIKAKVFYIPKNVGGRFSVLSNAALVPLALVGVDIKSLLKGAKKIKVSFFEEGYLKKTILKKALFLAKNHMQYHINVIFAYSEGLRYFVQWYVQLWGESLGKKQISSAFNVGLTPIGLIGPKDQHSFLQLIVEGTRDKTITFIKIKEFANSIKIPNITLKHLEELDIINNISFEKLINMQCDATLNSLLEQNDIPIDLIEINLENEDSIGQLIYYYELLTSIVGYFINVNTYNQPGVERGKIILKERLNIK
jgi:glucose-6-phosphate isomerase